MVALLFKGDMGGGGEEVTEGSWLPNKDDRVVIGPGAVPCSHEKGTFLEADKDILMHLEGGDRCPGLRRDVFVVRVEEFCGKGEKMKTPVERGERERERGVIRVDFSLGMSTL